jgi:hypothetical protein
MLLSLAGVNSVVFASRIAGSHRGVAMTFAVFRYTCFVTTEAAARGYESHGSNEHVASFGSFMLTRSN